MKQTRKTAEDGMEEERRIPGKESPFIQPFAGYHSPDMEDTVNTVIEMAEMDIG
jgi:hypothetical protein